MTEAIPKRLFDQANTLRKTLYQRSVQVPKIGTKQVFLAINPTPGGVKPYSSVSGGSQQKPAQQQSQAKPAAQSDQVSILVRPSAGGNAVLLNVPRNVALKVKIGTTLSFSASTDQKYTVIDNKLHPPVGKQRQQSPASTNHKPAPSTARPATNTHKPPPASSSRIPSLPSGVSIRPVAPGGGARQSVTSGRPSPASSKPLPPPSLSIHAQIARKPMPQLQPRPAPRQEPVSNFTPCSPFCPGLMKCALLHYNYSTKHIVRGDRNTRAGVWTMSLPLPPQMCWNTSLASGQHSRKIQMQGRPGQHATLFRVNIDKSFVTGMCRRKHDRNHRSRMSILIQVTAFLMLVIKSKSLYLVFRVL